MLSRVKQGITNRSKSSQSIRPTESETSLVRRLSGRRKESSDAERRLQSFEVGSGSIEGDIDETPESVGRAGMSVQRSFTNSTVSTAEVFGDSPVPTKPKERTPSLEVTPARSEPRVESSSPPLPSSPSPQPTPRPPPRKSLPPDPPPPTSCVALVLPCVDLYVALDSTTVDVHSKRDVWVAIEATVRSMCTTITGQQSANSTVGTEDLACGPTNRNELGNLSERLCRPASDGSSKMDCGTISSLRLCFKPVEGCSIREIIGQKTLKNLTVGQQCSLFLKLRVPKVRVRDSTIDPDQESLFTELESIVGTLKTEILHVEARYRHTMLPSDNVITVRQVCKIKRPKTESRWSTAGQSENAEPLLEAHMMLARYLASRYLPEKTMKLLPQYLGNAVVEQANIREIYDSVATETLSQEMQRASSIKPSVIVTDIDLSASASPAPYSDHFSTAPSTPLELNCSSPKPAIPCGVGHGRNPSTSSALSSTTLAPPLISAPKITTSLTTQDSSSTPSREEGGHKPAESHDSARQLWRHIRRTSLSAKQLEEMTPERLQHLEANDESLKELRRKALANKRSVGAETLRAWKWEESVQNQQILGEAPWM